MKKILVSTLKIIIPLGIGLYLTWYFVSKLTEEEFFNLKKAFFIADYKYILLTIVIALLSHMSRAYRWKYMLTPLGYQPSFWKMYHSVMIGYLINLTIPRSGEVARAGYYAKYEEKASFEKVFGTIIVERVFDMIMLGIFMLVTFYLQTDLEAFNNIAAQGKSGDESSNWIYFLVGGIAVVGGVVVFTIPKIRAKVLSLIKGVFEGIKTIAKLKQRGAFVAHTIFIWVCYVAMIWICTFALEETAYLSVNAVFAAFFVGSIAITATPGGIGLYPIMVSAVLSLYGVKNPEAFSMLAWTMLTVFTIIAGLVSLFALPFSAKKTA